MLFLSPLQKSFARLGSGHARRRPDHPPPPAGRASPAIPVTAHSSTVPDADEGAPGTSEDDLTVKRPFCGGIAGIPCPEGYSCIDDPSDSCDPLAHAHP